MSAKFVVGGVAAVTAGYLVYNINYNNNKDDRHLSTNPNTNRLNSAAGSSSQLPLKSHYNQNSNTMNRNIVGVKDANVGARTDSKSIFNWGFNEAERNRAIAIGEYDLANKKYTDLSKEFKENNPDLNDEENTVNMLILKDYEEELKEKRRILDEANEIYEKFVKNEDFNKLADKIYQENLDVMNGNKSFFKWLTSSGIEDDENTQELIEKRKGLVDEIASSSVMGWGENAQEFAKEEIQEKLRNKEIGPSEAQKRLDELKEIKHKGWMKYGGRTPEIENNVASGAAESLRGWGENAAQFAKDELDDVTRQYDENISFETAKENADKKLENLQICKQMYEQAIESKNGDFIWNKLFTKTNKDNSNEYTKEFDLDNIKKIEKDVKTHELKKALEKAENEYDHAIDILSKYLENKSLSSEPNDLKNTRTQLMGKLWDQLNKE